MAQGNGVSLSDPDMTQISINMYLVLEVGGKHLLIHLCPNFLLIFGNFSRVEKFRKWDAFAQKHVIMLLGSGLKDERVKRKAGILLY